MFRNGMWMMAAAMLAACGTERVGSSEPEQLAEAEQGIGGAGGVYTVAPGVYRGGGTWTDSNGRSGTMTDVSTIERLPDGNLRNTEVATYSDGRVLQLVVTYVQKGGSQYDVAVEAGGQSFVLGNGACGPNHCATTIATPAGQFVESTSYTRGKVRSMFRTGGFSDAATGVWTFYRFAETAF